MPYTPRGGHDARKSHPVIKYAALLLSMLSPVWHCVPDVPQGPLRARDSMVYMILIDALVDEENPHMVVEDSTAQFALRDDTFAQAVDDSFPPNLVAKLVERSRQPRLSATLPLRNRTLITRAKRAEIFREGPDGWTDFYSRYPTARGLLSLSPVVWSATGTTALVYFTWSCGGLCGAGALLLVEHTRGEWRITHGQTFWRS